MAYDTEFEIYKGKRIGSLFEDIVTNSENKRNQIDILLSDLRVMIKTPENALMIVPLIKEYLDVGVRNDEQLVKLAAIVQRMVSNTAGPDGESGSLMLTEEEKKQLMAQVESTITEMQSTVNTEKVEKLKEQS
jgi:hypothetical protein